MPGRLDTKVTAVAAAARSPLAKSVVGGLRPPCEELPAAIPVQLAGDKGSKGTVQQI